MSYIVDSLARTTAIPLGYELLCRAVNPLRACPAACHRGPGRSRPWLSTGTKSCPHVLDLHDIADLTHCPGYQPGTANRALRRVRLSHASWGMAHRRARLPFGAQASRADC